MFLEKFGIFILFLGPLVFFHELGHFLFARFFGVRVEVFSIGFGPKIFKFKKGDTEYAVSLIPLGGYVKMFGDDPLNKDAIPPAERPFSFTHKGKWARFWIVMGGPLANFIMAYFIFFTLLMIGEKLPEIRMGIIPSETNFYSKGLRSGDVIKKVNGTEIYNPTDIVLETGDLLKTVTVERLGERRQIIINSKSQDFFDEFVKYPPALRKPVVVDAQGNLFGVSLDPQKVNWLVSLDQMSERAGENQEAYLYKVVKDPTVPEIGYRQEGESLAKLNYNYKDSSSLIMALAARNYRALDLSVKSVNMNSPADEAGIRGNDVLISINGKKVYSFEELRGSLQETKDKSVSMELWRDGKVESVKVEPEIKMQNDKLTKLIGVYSGADYQGLRFIETPSKGFGTAFLLSFGRTWDTIVKTVESFKKLVSRQVSFKTIGGPLAIGKVASDSFNTSISYFFQLMALISVNLGVINLFPIPVLDGGHIMFIILEILNRGPVSRRKMEIAQQFGLSVLLLLMFGALYNDFSRFF